MTVKEIIQIENGNRNTIILLREGIFWRAYENGVCLLHAGASL